MNKKRTRTEAKLTEDEYEELVNNILLKKQKKQEEILEDIQKQLKKKEKEGFFNFLFKKTTEQKIVDIIGDVINTKIVKKVDTPYKDVIQEQYICSLQNPCSISFKKINELKNNIDNIIQIQISKLDENKPDIHIAIFISTNKQLEQEYRENELKNIKDNPTGIIDLVKIDETKEKEKSIEKINSNGVKLIEKTYNIIGPVGYITCNTIANFLYIKSLLFTPSRQGNLQMIVETYNN